MKNLIEWLIKAMTVYVVAFLRKKRNVTHSPLAYKYLIFIIQIKGERL